MGGCKVPQRKWGHLMMLSQKTSMTQDESSISKSLLSYFLITTLLPQSLLLVKHYYYYYWWQEGFNFVKNVYFCDSIIYPFEWSLNHFMPASIIMSVKFPKGPMRQNRLLFFYIVLRLDGIYGYCRKCPVSADRGISQLIKDRSVPLQSRLISSYAKWLFRAVSLDMWDLCQKFIGYIRILEASVFQVGRV